MDPEDLYEAFSKYTLSILDADMLGFSQPEAVYIYPDPDCHGQRYGELQYSDSFHADMVSCCTVESD